MLSSDEVARQRKLVVDEARSWTGTPYHPNAQVKGAGCDCLTLVVAAFKPVADYGAVPHYSKEWHLHHGDELYLRGTGIFKGILDYCVEMPGPEGEFDGIFPARDTVSGASHDGQACATRRVPLPGDIVIWKFGRCFAHGAIVAEWPLVIHAYVGRKVGPENVEAAPYLKVIGHGEIDNGKRRPRRFFTLKPWAEAETPRAGA